MGILATVNYDGIVEFPTTQSSNSNHNILYKSGFSHDPELESVKLSETSNLNDNKYGSSSNIENSNSTMHSVGNKMWLPAFNMTASSIQSKQSVRMSQEPYMHTPNQYLNKAGNYPDMGTTEMYQKQLNYTPEVHQAKPRTFGNSNNPSMTTHSMNVASSHNTMIQNHHTDSTRSNTFYSKDNLGKNNPNISDKLKILKSSAKMNPNNNNQSPISQLNSHKESTLSDYNPVINNKLDRFSSEKKMFEGIGSRHGPIKATEFNDIPSHASLKTEVLPSNTSDLDDNQSENNHRYKQFYIFLNSWFINSNLTPCYRYSQQSNKSSESRNRGKNSFSQKKPQIKGKKNKSEIGERPLSIDARSQDSLSDKLLSPEAEWKHILSDIQKKNNWEKQFKACNTIKDFSLEHPNFFTSNDAYFSEIMTELSTL